MKLRLLSKQFLYDLGMYISRHVYTLTRVCVRSEDHLGGVGLNFTSEIIYLQPLDRSAAAGALVIYSPWSGSGSEERRRGNTFYCVLCAGCVARLGVYD